MARPSSPTLNQRYIGKDRIVDAMLPASVAGAITAAAMVGTGQGALIPVNNHNPSGPLSRGATGVAISTTAFHGGLVSFAPFTAVLVIGATYTLIGGTGFDSNTPLYYGLVVRTSA